MKKIITLIILLIILNGCSLFHNTETTKCTNDLTASIITIQSRSGEIIKETSVTTTTLSRLNLTVANYYHYVAQTQERYGQRPGFEINFERSDQIVVITIIIDFSLFDNYENLETDLQLLLEQLQESGYVCILLD